MGGGLMQLVAYGAQDIYLTGNPQITFFKVVYRRHTNFSMESISQTFSGQDNYGGTATTTISRNGDLVGRLYLEHSATITSTADATAQSEIVLGADYGSNLIKEAELEIGGQRIDRHYGHWHSVYSDLTESTVDANNNTLYNRMVGNGIPLASNGDSGGAWTCTDSVDTGTVAHGKIEGTIFVPLNFWFCRNPGLALPLIALQYHEVKVKITLESLNKLVQTIAATDSSDTTTAKPPSSADAKFVLWADYIYLDTDERRRFAQVSHEYLIEQVQQETFASGGTMTLNFNHPIKELIWAGSRGTGWDDVAAASDPNVALEKCFKREPIGAKDGKWQLKLNGHDRFAERVLTYFTRVQVWQHHGGAGSSDMSKDSVAVYSFALKPDEHQPSGTCNFSRIDNAQLIGPTVSTGVTVYAINYNVLRIMSGMGGLAYSN